MNQTKRNVRPMRAALAALAVLTVSAVHGDDAVSRDSQSPSGHQETRVQLGPRPFYLVDKMKPSFLKMALAALQQSCGREDVVLDRPPRRRPAVPRAHQGVLRSGGAHGRGHPRVRRDLHQGPRSSSAATRSATCTPRPTSSPSPSWPPSARSRSRPPTRRPARRRRRTCCTSDITLAEFKTLCGKMDASIPRATTVAEYLGGTPTFRTDLYSTCGTLLTPRREHRAHSSSSGVEVHARAQGAERADAVRRATTRRRCTRSR